MLMNKLVCLTAVHNYHTTVLHTALCVCGICPSRRAHYETTSCQDGRHDAGIVNVLAFCFAMIKTRGVQKVCSLTQLTATYVYYVLVIFRHNLLQVIRTWSSDSPKHRFHCRRIIEWLRERTEHLDIFLFSPIIQ